MRLSHDISYWNLNVSPKCPLRGFNVLMLHWIYFRQDITRLDSTDYDCTIPSNRNILGVLCIIMKVQPDAVFSTSTWQISHRRSPMVGEVKESLTCSLGVGWPHILGKLLQWCHGTFCCPCLKAAGSQLAPSDPDSGQRCSSLLDHPLWRNSGLVCHSPPHPLPVREKKHKILLINGWYNVTSARIHQQSVNSVCVL